MSIYKIQQFHLNKLIFEQKPCFLGPFKQEPPWRNWYYYTWLFEILLGMSINDVQQFFAIFDTTALHQRCQKIWRLNLLTYRFSLDTPIISQHGSQIKLHTGCWIANLTIIKLPPKLERIKFDWHWIFPNDSEKTIPDTNVLVLIG